MKDNFGISEIVVLVVIGHDSQKKWKFSGILNYRYSLTWMKG